MAEAINNETRLFKAELNDGSKVTYKVIWQGVRDLVWNESGAPSTYTPFHPFDDRQCHWTVSGCGSRGEVAVEIAGQDYFNDNMQKVFAQNATGKGSDFQVLQLRPENCGDCSARRQSDYDDMAANVNGVLKATVENDVQNVINDIKGLPGIIKVNV